MEYEDGNDVENGNGIRQSEMIDANVLAKELLDACRDMARCDNFHLGINMDGMQWTIFFAAGIKSTRSSSL